MNNSKFEHEYTSIHIIQGDMEVDVMCLAERTNTVDQLRLAIALEKTRWQKGEEEWERNATNN